MKRLIKVLVLAGLIALAVLGVSRLRALLGNHVFVPDAVDSANENHPPTEDDPLYHLGSPNDAHVPGGGETADGFVIPAYEGEEIVPIHNNVPDFSAKEISTTEFLKFSELDDLGRVGRAEACIGPSMLATEERGSIGMIKPAGWHTAKYEFIDGLYLYNRCHLIAYSLCGVNADERNLMTGTRYLNIEGMLGIENRVYWYVRDTGNHVCYRVTPRYIGDNLLADGVQMEAYSVEDHGKRISLNVFCYNVQPGVLIDYKTGDNSLDPDVDVTRMMPEDSHFEERPSDLEEDASRLEESSQNIEESSAKSEVEAVNPEKASSDSEEPVSRDITSTLESGDSTSSIQEERTEEITYILNTNTMRFHLSDCPSVQEMKRKNRKEFFGTREELIEAGYEPCGRCHP